MITYNHEKFIAEAIEGVLMQEVDFQIELVIADDCSIDNTSEIIKQIVNNHPKGHWIKYIRRNNNTGPTFNFFEAIKECGGEFTAFCEGDDYWIDPLKLSNGVNFLKENPSFSSVSHYVNRKSLGGQSSIIGKFEKEEFVLSDLNKRFLIFPLSSFICRKMVNLPEWFYKLYGGDAAIAYFNLCLGRHKVLPFLGSVYRIHLGGIEQNYKKDRFSLPKRNVREYSIYLDYCLPSRKLFFSKRVSWNYFYLSYQYLLQFRFLSMSIKLLYSLKYFLLASYYRILHG